MNRLGIQSLNAGAPDLRLTGDQTQRGTYTQRRRDQMAYGGTPGADGRRQYGIGSWFQEKIKDPIKEKFVDPAIDMVTDVAKSPVGKAALAYLGTGALGSLGAGGGLGSLTQLGTYAPSTVLGNLGTSLGNLRTGASKLLGGGGGENLTYGMPTGQGDYDIYGNKIPETGGQELSPFRKALATILPGGDPGFVPGGLYNQIFGTGEQQIGPDGKPIQRVNWQIPMAIGAGAGAYQKKYLEDQPPFPMDETGIKFQTGAEAMADPTLRFKPKAEYADVAEGGRIGYALGGNEKEGMFEAFDRYKSGGGPKGFIGWYGDVWLPDTAGFYGPGEARRYAEEAPSALDEWPYGFAEPGTIGSPEAIGIEYNAQGGRIGYANGRGPHFEMPTFSEGVQQEFPSNELGALAAQAADGGNMIQDITMSLIKDGYSTEEALKHAHQINAVESDNYPGLSKIVTSLITSGISPEEAIKKAAQIMEASKIQNKAQGGRIGLHGGSKKWPYWTPSSGAIEPEWDIDAGDMPSILRHLEAAKSGGRIGAQEGGLMDLGGMEKDYRQEGGFVPLGGEEKADDVPARLSKNEFVFTADAVRAAGGGDIDAGAEVMENVMKNLEAGGEVSEDSQGLEGARGMFANAQELQKRII
jgi:hypothetical protein